MDTDKKLGEVHNYVDQYLYTTDYSQVTDKQNLIDNKLIREAMMLSAVSLHWPPSVYTQPE